ncbi:MAG: hypothetical protein WBI82_05315 [Sphaerochaeta sp.]
MIFSTPNNALVNFDFIYFRRFYASGSLSNSPIVKKVSVCPIKGAHTRSVDKTSPIAPEPLDSGIM